jgi:hypothetical protein
MAMSLDIDQTNNHIHMAYQTSGSAIYHSELKSPLAPNVDANWSNWGGFRYQRVDNNGGGNPCIGVDGSGNPHVVWVRDAGANDKRMDYNYGGGGTHAFTTASTIALASGLTLMPKAWIEAVAEETRDLYAFYTDNNIMRWRYCDKANNPLVLGNWTGAATIITCGGTIDYIETAHWYSPGGAFAQIMAIARCGAEVRSCWYDEGNVNGWGGGWRDDPNGIQEFDSSSTIDWVQVTNSSANDFGLLYHKTGTMFYFGYTAYASTRFIFAGAAWSKASNDGTTDFNTAMRAIQTSPAIPTLYVKSADDLYFILVRTNSPPSSTGFNPDGGIHKNELAIITLSWTFVDPGQSQSQLQAQAIGYATDWSGTPIWDSGVIVSATPSRDIPAATLAYATHYKWRVKVWDDEKGTEYDPYSAGDWCE